MQRKIYTVAGHTFAVVFPSGMDTGEALVPYEPFADEAEEAPLFELEVMDGKAFHLSDTGDLWQCFHDEAPYLWLYRRESSYVFGFSNRREQPECLLFTSEDYRRGHLHLFGCPLSFALSNSLMLLYAFNTATFDTLLVHASVVEQMGAAYLFLGKSGTGKSTHARLWLEHIEGSRLLNDDNPVVRLRKGEAWVYGSPWSGKTPCYQNERASLKAIVRLEQAPVNQITRLPLLPAYASLRPSCSCMNWDRRMADGVHHCVGEVARLVPSFLLRCRPDEEAARVCLAEIKKADSRHYQAVGM